MKPKLTIRNVARYGLRHDHALLISRIVCAWSGYKLHNIRASRRPGRAVDVALTKMVLATLLYEELRPTIQSAARFLHYRDHSSIIAARKRIHALCDTEDVFALEVEHLRGACRDALAKAREL